jgi:hypothetical protein
MVFGIVVEDRTDACVYSTLIQRIRPDVDPVLQRPCGGVAGVRRQFVGWLKNFEWHAGHQVGKALIIRDSDSGDQQFAEDELARILRQSRFRPSFPFHFYATKCEVETWLLADERAVNSVAQMRGKAPWARPVAGTLEDFCNAKELFRRMLSQAGLPADPVVYAEVAAAADMELIRRRCPHFQQFVDRVHAC